MERVERMHAAQTLPTKELDREAIGAAIRPFLVAEFATAIGSDTLAFKPNQLVEK